MGSHSHDGATIYAVNPWNVAVIGYGLSAKVFHIPLINAIPDLKLYGIVQRSPKPDNDASKDHQGVKSWRSVEEMLKDDEVDIVVITSIPNTHYSMCKEALEAGKNVVVEKPFVPTAKEADELIALAKEKGRWITVYQNRRWDSDYLTVRQIMKEGSMGDIVEFETHFDRHRPDPPPANTTWKVEDQPGNGSIYDLGVHLIDQVYHAFGMPKRVTGFVLNQRRQKDGSSPPGAHDSCTVLLHYERLLVTVKAGVVSPHVRQLRYWIRGTKGSFHKFHLDVQEDQLKAGLNPGDKGFAEDPESHFGVLTTDEEGKMVRNIYPTVEPATYTAFYRGVANALKSESDADLPVKAEDARDVLRIIEAARKSSDEGRTIDM